MNKSVQSINMLPKKFNITLFEHNLHQTYSVSLLWFYFQSSFNQVHIVQENG